MKTKNTEETAEKKAGFSGTPYFADETINRLPENLRKILSQVSHKRHRDVLFFSLIIGISAVFKNIFGFYHGRRVYPSLFGVISAPPASGKNMMLFAKTALSPIHAYIREKYKSSIKEWKENESQDKSSKPPKQSVFLIPANTTHAGILLLLSASPFGIIIDSEADGLRIMLENVHGNWSDLLRKAFHHEPIGSFRKTEEEYLEVDEVKLALLLSGTPDQIPTLLKAAENGLLSRLIFYAFEEEPKFEDPFSKESRNLDESVRELGQKLLVNFTSINERQIEFSFTSDQAIRFNKKFPETLSEYYDLAGSEGAGVALRLGLIFFRIAMVLTAIRGVDQEVLLCSDEDFNLTDNIIEVVSGHSMAVLSALPQREETSRRKGPPILEWLEYMPTEFTTAKWLNDCSVRGYKDRQAKRFLKDIERMGKIVSIKQGHYKKLHLAVKNEHAQKF